MTMPRLSGGLLLIASVGTFAQSSEKPPVFETASIKPSDPTDPASSWNMNPGRLTVHNMSLKKLVMAAYEVKEFQVTGGPKWFDSDRFDIAAKLESTDEKSARSREGAVRVRRAMQALLADRFQLLVHQETRPVSGLALVTRKTGFKLKPVDGSEGSSIRTGRGRITAKGISLAGFAGVLATQLGQPVVDSTGIQGVFDFQLEWTPDESSETGTSLFAGIEETLGLKFEAQKVPVPIIAIDRAEKPGEN